MNEVWDLSPLYYGFDDPAFEEDLAALKDAVARASAFAAELPAVDALAGLRRGIALEEQVAVLVGKLANYGYLRQAADTRDMEAGSQIGRVMAVYSDFSGSDAAFRAWASALPDLMDLVRGDDDLKDYAFLFENMQRSSRYLLPGRGEEIMAKMEMSGTNAWSELQQYLTSTVPVSYRDTTITLPAVRNMAYEADPQVRKDAYEAELTCYDRIRDAVCYAMNSIKLETISDCSLRGYASPLERTLKQSDMERATLDAMLSAMDEYLPKFWQYLKAKAKALGHEQGLPWYDLFAPMGNSSTRFTPAQARDYLVELFGEFDPELAEMTRRAFDESWIDFFPREGKSGGAFCADLNHVKQSRILTNFDGMFGDVVVLAHELGHAFHNHCVFGNRVLNQGYSMPLAETASTFNECVVTDSAISRAADKQEKIALLESQLQGITQVICDIYSRYLFESRVFENREERFMDADTLCDFMLTAQKQAYGDGLDHSKLHPYMWICKGHYYGATFYNFPYAFGALFARGLYACYEREGADFVPKYKKLLNTTPVSTAEDVAKVAGIDLTDKNFWRAALQTIADRIDQFCELLEE